jgi:hypothetical protein
VIAFGLLGIVVNKFLDAGLYELNLGEDVVAVAVQVNGWEPM